MDKLITLMKKIEFEPLRTPLKNRLEVLAAGAGVFATVMGGVVGICILLYLFFYTTLWSGVIVYLIFTYYDIDASELGGRWRSQRVRRWLWWKYFNQYFPVRLKKVGGVTLDPNRNYLFCCFPHGVLPTAFFSAFATDHGGFQEQFPQHTSSIYVLRVLLCLPITREILLGTGAGSVTTRSLDCALGTGCGKVAALLVGGAAEALCNKPGIDRVVLHNRRGFIKIALRNGAPLVPVYSFGETNAFDQVEHPTLRKCQEWIKSKIGVSPVIPIGRGLFQLSFGLVPRRTPIYTVVGKPIEVEKVVNPTREQVDDLHAKFVQALRNLYDEQKHNYVSNPETAHLIID